MNLAKKFLCALVLLPASSAFAEIPINLLVTGEFEPATLKFKKEDLEARSDPDLKATKSFAGGVTAQAEFVPLGPVRALVGASARVLFLNLSDTFSANGGNKVDVEMSAKPFLIGFEGGFSFPFSGSSGIMGQVTGGYEFSLNEPEADVESKAPGTATQTDDAKLTDFGRAAFRARVNMPLPEAPNVRTGLVGSYTTGSGGLKGDDSTIKFDYSAFGVGLFLGWTF